MAKPILVIRVNNRESVDYAKVVLRKGEINNEYHVMIVACEVEDVSFECYNDCKGLSDIDIEKLIKELRENSSFIR